MCLINFKTAKEMRASYLSLWPIESKANGFARLSNISRMHISVKDPFSIDGGDVGRLNINKHKMQFVSNGFKI